MPDQTDYDLPMAELLWEKPLRPRRQVWWQ
jgi:hypothetical protein